MLSSQTLPALAPSRLFVPGSTRSRARRGTRTYCWLTEVTRATAPSGLLAVSDPSFVLQGPGVSTQWSQNLQHVYVKVPVPDGVKARSIAVDLKRHYVSVQLDGSAVLQGSLEDHNGIEPADSFWELEQQEDGSRVLLVTLQKRSPAPDLMAYEPWPRLMDTEDRNTTITHRVFMDIQIGRKVFGRIVLGLYGRTVPRTVENFRALCTGELGVGARGVPLTYKGSKILKILPGFLIHGGDIVKNDGTAGDSIYGSPFPDENFVLRHDAAGKVAMANFGINSNLSQFHILLAAVPFLDAKHVVFGEVVHGMQLVRLLEQMTTVEGDKPEVPVVIADCGELTEEEFQAMVDTSDLSTKEAPLQPLKAQPSLLTKVDIGGTDWS